MRRRYLYLPVVCLLGMLLSGCWRLDPEAFWIRENVPSTPSVPVGTTEIQFAQTEETTGLRMDGGITGETYLCFCADLQDLCNDLSLLLERQIVGENWQMEKTAAAPYSRMDTQYLRLDADPILKNEPTLCVYLTEEGQLCEITAILLTHDWTQAQEASFMQLGSVLLRCFWPDCETDVLEDTAEKLRGDMDENIYPDNSAVTRPMRIYVHGSAAAYSYTHAAHISFNVIPVNDARLQELEKAGLEIVIIP